jgi:hypothetical protein
MGTARGQSAPIWPPSSDRSPGPTKRGWSTRLISPVVPVSGSTISPRASRSSSYLEGRSHQRLLTDEQFVFNRSRDGKSELWRADSNGTHAALVLGVTATLPAVTPDGSRVLFVSQQSGIQSPWIVNIDGTNSHELLRMRSNPDVHVSPDCRFVAFPSGNRDGVEVAIAPISGGTLCDASTSSARLRDGRVIATSTRSCVKNPYPRLGAPSVTRAHSPQSGGPPRSTRVDRTRARISQLGTVAVTP